MTKLGEILKITIPPVKTKKKHQKQLFLGHNIKNKCHQKIHGHFFTWKSGIHEANRTRTDCIM